MSSSDYTEVTLENSRDLPPDIRETHAELSTTRDLSEDEIIDYAAHNKKITAMQDSRMRRWLSKPPVETERRRGDGNKQIEQIASFPIAKVIPEIVRTIREVDVTLVVAPTGAGKSISAPIVADILARSLEDPGFKTLHVGPSVEHAASTARAFKKLCPQAFVGVSAFLNPEKELRAFEANAKIRLGNCRDEDTPADFAYSTYHAAVPELPHANLSLLVLDEIHELNDNVQVTIAMATKMMLAQQFNSALDKKKSKQRGCRTLNKLLLLTATMDDEQRKKHKAYFTSNGLSFKSLDYSHLIRNNLLTLSCLPGTPLPENFKPTSLAGQILRVLERKQGVSLASLQPDPRDLITRMVESLNATMGLAAENLRERLKARRRRREMKREGGEEEETFGADADLEVDYDMQTIIVILPGLEPVDKIYSSVRKLPNFKFDGEPAFHVVRQTSLVKDDPSVTSECTIQSKWGGKLGRIVLTTNFVAAGLTVPNAAFVLDMGRQNIPAEYARNALKSLEMTWIDKMMIIQRAGRTGRTTDGEYFLPYPVEKVDKMIKTDHGEVLLNRNFEEKHLFFKTYYKLHLIHDPPEKLIKELQKSMENRGLYCPLSGFSKDSILMYSLFNMLTPEQARFVVQGTRLGVAAHAVYLVAHEKSRIKFCHVGTFGRGKMNGPSETQSALDLYCEAMDGMEMNYEIESNPYAKHTKLPAKYRGVGDSIALADLLVSFYSQPNKKNLNAKGIFNNFWSGNRDHELDRFTFDYLYASFVREEGDDAVSRYVDEIEWALKRAGILQRDNNPQYSEIGVFDEDFNRHIVSKGNYCLDEDGRTLISALLTMHASRICKMKWKEGDTVYEIFREETAKAETLYPESTFTQPTKFVKNNVLFGRKRTIMDSGAIYGRYQDMFKRSGKFTGLIDPVTLKQLVFFFNINGLVHSRSDQRENSFTFLMNASTGKSGMKIMTSKSLGDDAYSMRPELERAMKVLTLPPDRKGFIKNLEQFIINLWRECEKTVATPPERSTRASSPPPDYTSVYANGRPATMLEWKEREALNNSTARPATLRRSFDREGAGEGRRAAEGAQRGGGSGSDDRGERGDGSRERGGRGERRGPTRGGGANQSKNVYTYSFANEW